MLARHLRGGRACTTLGRRNAIHLNDTHPALAPAELMRPADGRTRSWPGPRPEDHQPGHRLHQPHPDARGPGTWPVRCSRCCCRDTWTSSTASTTPSAGAAPALPGDEGLAWRVSLIDEVDHGGGAAWPRWPSWPRTSVNGVSALHTELLVQTIFADYAALARALPQRDERVTPAPLAAGQPGLSALDRWAIGTRWRTRSTLRSWRRADGPGAGQPSWQVQARQQGAPAERIRRDRASTGRPGQPVRRADQTHPRIQAPAAQPAARGGALPGHPGDQPTPTGCRA